MKQDGKASRSDAVAAGGKGRKWQSYGDAAKKADKTCVDRSPMVDLAPLDDSISLADGTAARVPVKILPPHLRSMHHNSVGFEPPAVAAADMMYYRSCVAVYESKKEQAGNVWEKGYTAEAKLYRAVRDLNMPMQRRAVASDTTGVARGFNYGLTG